jgi:hypothetical protein
MPGVESSSSCQQIIDRNILSNVRCTESHRLRWLARGAAGAYMTMVQSLELKSVFSPPQVVQNTTTEDSGRSFASSFDDDDEDEDDEEEEIPELSGQVHKDPHDNAPWIIIQEVDDYITTLLDKTPLKITKRENMFFQHDYNRGKSRTKYDTASIALSNFCSSIRVGLKKISFAIQFYIYAQRHI